LIGKIISHYRILEKIGEGGMGVVYKAEDTKLKRTVALKFLPPELTRDSQARARFVQEAQAAAALDHPNICTVFEIGEAEGATYIVMPFIKGQSLKERIAAGSLSVDDALAIAGQVGEGLKEAHEKGIIHRDIKPANIMLTEKGQAKIMDFGLAKLEAGVDLTKTMAVLGTVAYMSPEQARGEEVDHRTDIWSFGATLYEMLTGQKPFGQKHDQALIYSILNDTTEAASRIRPEIPKPLERVIQRALEKDRSRRYQNMAELIKDLKSNQPSGFPVPKADKSIIVLPFEDISPGKDNEYFSDGLTEEIITDLSHVHNLLVISRSSAMTFKGTKKKIPDIAREVNVRYVLEGSVRKAGNELRITAQLIDATNDAHLWAEKYAGTLDDVFSIQEKVARSIIDALRLKITHHESHRLAEKPIANIIAYEYYLQAKREIWSFNQENLDHALRLTNQALDIVGDNALLYATLALIYWQYHNAGFKPEEDMLRQANIAAGKALDLDSELAQGHGAMGAIAYTRGELPIAARYYKRAAELESGGEALAWLSLIHALAGRMSEARQYGDQAIKLDPLNILALCLRGLIEIYGGDYETAVIWLQKGREVMPGDPMTLGFCAIANLYAGNRNISLALFDQLKVSDAGLLSSVGALISAAVRGEGQAVMKFIIDIQAYARRDKEISWSLADCLALIGDTEGALNWLSNSIELGLINDRFFAEYDPSLAPLRGDRRFQALMERAREKQKAFVV
jgi:eukaryotic-like serine/threonine-protein kinase